MTFDGKQMYLDPETPITWDAWEVLKSKSDSKFVRDIATILWGIEGLAKRCLDAPKANESNKNATFEGPRTELTPEKYETVKGKMMIFLSRAF